MKSNRKWPLEQVERAIELYNAGGKTWREIAQGEGYTDLSEAKLFIQACTNRRHTMRKSKARKKAPKYIDVPAIRNFEHTKNITITITGDTVHLAHKIPLTELTDLLRRLT